MRITNLRVTQIEGVEGLLNLFAFAEQRWCTWDKLEEKIAEVKYEQFTEEYLDWFIDFLMNAVMRIWRTSKPDENLNRVRDEGQAFLICNYDWNAYKFGRQKGLDQDLTTKTIVCIDKDNLTEQEIEWLRSKYKCQG